MPPGGSPAHGDDSGSIASTSTVLMLSVDADAVPRSTVRGLTMVPRLSLGMVTPLEVVNDSVRSSNAFSVLR